MFQKRIVEKYSAKLNKTIIDEKYDLFRSIFANPEKQENIRNSKEEQYQEGFLRDLFVSVLGYTINPEPNYNLLTEQKNISKGNDNRKADGAVIFDNKVKVVIELKGTDTTDLNKIESQAFLYKEHNPECKYVVISNFERLRFYVENAIEFIEFNLFHLSRNDFQMLYLCLEINQIKNDIPLQLKHETLSQEQEITDSFYSDYSVFKRNLFEDIYTNNPDYDKLLLFKKTQKLLDRILFILFCEDRGLLPENSVSKIIAQWEQLKDLDAYQPLYARFQNYFNRINEGYTSPKNPSENIFAYNGGLFKPDEILDNIKIGDDVLFLYSKRLSDYDFESQISVDILGNIFEHSLTEIEEVQKQIEAEKSGLVVQNNDVGKRKKDGVFYTPAFITKYIVENTIGKLCNEKKEELGIKDSAFSKSKKTSKEKDELNNKLEDYKQWLLSLKILDPACGSGAFLNAALKQLKIEHTLIDYYRAKIYGDSMIFQDVENDILEKNIFGVDINEESVEIAKLSLWLHTAQKNRKLTTLNNNIKCGNSLINDPEVAGEKAFYWQKEFPEVFEKGGFDVVIGNPPYVRAELLPTKDISFYKKTFTVFNPDGDLFSYFYENGIRLLKENGLFGFISNTFDKTTAGITLRNFISKQTKIEQYIDFTNVQVFSGATTYPIILLLKKTKTENNNFIYKKIPSSMNGKVNIDVCNSVIVSQKELNNECWSFNDSKLNSVMKKLSSFKTVFEKYGKCFYGVKTALNEAFFIDETTKNRLIEEDSKSADLIKKVFEGKDLSKWTNLSINKYILLVHNGYNDVEAININDYPTIKKHLDQFYDKLEKRYDKGKTPYNLRNCAYQASFEKNKVIWGNLQNSNKFSYDEDKTIISAPCCMLPTENKSLVSILNSKIVWKFLTSICVVRNGGYIEVKPQYFEQIPIPDFENNKELDEITEKMLSLNKELQKLSSKFIGRLKESLGVEKITSTLEEFFNYDFETLVKELSKQKIKLSLKQKDEWEDYFTDYKNEITGINQQIETTDKEINSLVYKLYELTPEEIQTIENAE